MQELDNEVILLETNIDSHHEWLNKPIKEINPTNNFLIVLIKRKNDSFVPNGDTVIRLGDTIIFNEEI